MKTILNNRHLSSQPPAWRNIRVWILGALFATGTAAILILPLLATGQVNLNAGEVAAEDIRAPHSLNYESDILTNQARDDAERSVPTQYDPLDPRVARQQIA